MKRQKTHLSPKRLFVLSAVLAALIVSAVAAYVIWYRPTASPTTAPVPYQSDNESSPYDTSPATPEEQKAADERKQDTPQSTPTTPSTQKKQVTVVITSATKDSINAYVDGVLEDGGVCTATLTKGGTIITRKSYGFVNVSTTNCQPINPEFPSGGAWNVTLTYSSDTAEGSAQTIVGIP